MIWRRAILAALIIFATSPTLASADVDRPDQKACFDRRSDQSTDLDKRIEVCLHVIGDSTASADIRAEAYLRRALAYAQKSELSHSKDDIERAIADLAEGMRLDPNNVAAQRYALQMRAGLYYHKEDYDRAVADYTTLLGLEPDWAAGYNYRGIVFATTGDYSRAIADFTEAIRRQPMAAEFYNQRALSYLQAGNPVDALADADRTVALGPNEADSYRTRIVVNRAIGNTAEVVNDLRKALALAPANEAIKQELQFAEAAASAVNAKTSQTASAVANDPNADARRDYELAAKVGTVGAWQAYLKEYSAGFYADLARENLAAIERAERSKEEQARRAQAEQGRLTKEQADQ